MKWDELQPWRAEYLAIHNETPVLSVGSTIISGDEESPRSTSGAAAQDAAEPPPRLASDGAAAHISADEYECSLCHELLFRPVTLACGHSYCETCLCQLAKSSASKKCPQCRRCFSAASVAAVSVDFSRLLESVFPAETAERRIHQAEVVAASTVGTSANSTQTETLGVFVLEPLLPHQTMQLHVFERRYRSLVQQSLEGAGTFGMAFETRTPDDSAVLFTKVAITESRPLPGGRFHITIVGKRMFRADSVDLGDTGFLVARGSVLDLDAQDAEAAAAAGAAGGSADDLTVTAEELVARADEWMRLVREGGHERAPRHLSRVLDELGPMPPPWCPSQRAFYVAALINPLPGLGVAPEIRPAILRARCGKDRLAVAREGVDRSIASLEALRRSPLRRLLRALQRQLPPQALVVVAVLGASFLFDVVARLGTTDHMPWRRGAPAS